MEILAHRGYWKIESEKNTLQAFQRAFESGYGIETDVRDYMGKLVISHNVADEKCPLFEDVLKLYNKTKCKEYLAINIKADGLQEQLHPSSLYSSSETEQDDPVRPSQVQVLSVSPISPLQERGFIQPPRSL